MDLPARHAALGLVVATLLAGPACVGPAPGVGAAPPRGDRPSGWIEVSSAHVGIVSALDESATLEIAARLEIFRRAVAFLTNLGDAEARVPTRFYLFRDRTRFVELVRETAGGFFLPRMRHNLAALDASGANPTLNVLYHEYAHFLISGGTRPLPIWFEEGAAGLLERRERDLSRPSKPPST